MGYHSYMVKYWQDTKMAMIKLTPKGGMRGKWQTGLKRSYVQFKGQRTAAKGWQQEKEWEDRNDWQSPAANDWQTPVQPEGT
eukprot:7939515-Heterocapsa_arctica.AAC.1